MTSGTLGLFNPIMLTGFEMTRGGDASFRGLGKVSAFRRTLFSHAISCQVMQAVLLGRPYVRILKASALMKKALKDASYQLYLDRSSFDKAPGDSRVLDVPLSGVLDAGQPLKFDFSKSHLFQAKAWGVEKKEPLGDPVALFLANGTMVEADITWNTKPPGAAELEVGFEGTLYKAPLVG